MRETPLFKQCPNCQQFSPEDSSVCLQCGYSFDTEHATEDTREAGGLEGLSRQPPENSEEQAPEKKRGCLRKGGGGLVVVGLLIVLSVIGFILPNDFDEPTTSIQSTNTPVPTFTSTPAGSTVTQTTSPSDTEAQAQPTKPQDPPTPVRPTATPTQRPMVTINSDMNVREGPGTNYPVIGTVSSGQQFPITGKNPAGDWWKINYNGRDGWVFGQLVSPTNAKHVQIAIVIPTPPSTPKPTSTPRPRPTRTPIVTLDKTERANMWVYISNNEYFMLVYADPAFDIEKFELDLFIDGREYGHSNKIYADEGPRKLSGGPEQRSHASVQRVSAQTPSGDLRCVRHTESDSYTSVFACVFR